MNQYGVSSWTDERTALLRKLWAEGLSASQVANQLKHVTRNAVIGKVHRLGLQLRGNASNLGINRARRPRRTKALPLQPRFNKVKPPPLQSELHKAAALKPIDPTLSVLGLNAFTCHYPIGDPQDAGFSFCGRTCSLAGPYCADHTRLAYVPVKKRTRDATARLANWLDKRSFKVAA